MGYKYAIVEGGVEKTLTERLNKMGKFGWNVIHVSEAKGVTKFYMQKRTR